MNAILDALTGAGVGDLDMPATSGRVWAAMAAAKSFPRKREPRAIGIFTGFPLARE
jgi:hypothetical protein